jgi:hypothetical protein
MARPTVPVVGEPEWGPVLIDALYDISDRADTAIAGGGGGGGFVGGVTANDIEISDSTKGLILKSPNGSRWRINVGNDGALTTTAL